MSSDTPGERLGRAAAALAARPRDLDAWWRLCAALAAAERPDEARSGYAELGRAASELGSVALAVACARTLAAAGDEKRARAVADRIAKLHGAGARRVDMSLRHKPPGPPPEAAAEVEAPTELEAAAALAAEAVRSAARSARERAPKKLPPTPLIGGLDARDIGELIGVMKLREFRRGDVVLDVGQAATALYWMARGGAEVSRGECLLGELRAGAFFGEIALVGNTTRTARVACLEDTTLLEIPAEVVQTTAERAPKLARVLAGYARSRLLSNVMRTSELFSRLSTEERRTLLPRFSAKMVDQGEAILTTGADNDRLWVVASGSFEVREDGGVVARLGVGDGAGEMSMLGRRPATADVVAVEPSVVLSIARDAFDEVAVAHPGLLAEVYKLLVEREREADALVHDAEDLIL